jgi:protein-L-isoaspartate(D-aspartate) O-methyltransferase
MAVMLEMLDVAGGQRVLEVGAGTGYNATLLSHLVGRGGSVTSVDVDPTVTAAVANLAHAGNDEVEVGTGDGWLGLPSQCFDRMIVIAECWVLSHAWVEQLVRGGRLVAPLWLRLALTVAVALEKENGERERRQWLRP